jgi:cell division septal protein FtsQ
MQTAIESRQKNRSADRSITLRFYAALVGAVLTLAVVVWLIATDRWNEPTASPNAPAQSQSGSRQPIRDPR